MLSFSPVGPSTSAITTGGSHRQISYNGSLLRVNPSSQTPNGQVFTTHNGFLYERVCCTRMYWNSSTGESDPEATALRPSNRECFLVMRRSLFLMAATILSSEPWCVLIEYRWQPGTEVEEMQIKRHYLRCVVHWRCPNNGCRQPLQRSKHLVWDRFSHISWSVKINLKESAPLKQQFFSGVQLILFFIVCENLKIQHEGRAPTHLLRTTFKYCLYYGNRTPTKSRCLLLITTCSQSGLRWVAKTHSGEVPLFTELSVLISEHCCTCNLTG